MIWNEKAECMSRDEIQAIQLEKLQKTVERVYYNVPFYRKAFQERGIEPGDIKTLNDLKKLPFTYKQDLRDHYPFGLFAVPKREVVRIHSSSGTTGKPTVVGYTKKDLDVWTELTARVFAQAGVTPDDTVQICLGYGLFTGGLGMHYGAEHLGAAIVPASGGNTQRQLRLMRDFGTTAVSCSPSYALHIADVAADMGIDIKKDLNLKWGLFGSEPWSEAMRVELEERLGVKSTDNYGLSEVCGPGVAGECLVQDGMHIAEDHFIVEVINPETGETLDYGQEGELVFTSLSKEAFPVIRYRTRDITVLNPQKCACGRTHVRMSKTRGRTDDMLIIRGVNVFPSQIESVLLGIGDTEPHYQLILDKKGALDELEVWVEVSERLFSDKMRSLHELEQTIRREMESVLGISVGIKLVEPKAIPRSEGKAKRVIDNRGK